MSKIDDFIMARNPSWEQVYEKFTTEEINEWVEEAAGQELDRRNRAAQSEADRAAEVGRRVRAAADAAAERRRDMAAAWILGADRSPAPARAAIDQADAEATSYADFQRRLEAMGLLQRQVARGTVSRVAR